MAGASLLALLDDLTSVLDDVALLTKVAARKTTAVLGDDLALNAQQVAGLQAARELPVVWAVAKGSFRNKLILVPAALAISAFLPWLVTPLLMVGGAYLCLEGLEKVVHRLHGPGSHGSPERAAAAAAPGDPGQLERDKIRGAVRTDFILSAEIVAITLGTVASAPVLTRLLVLSGIALAMTVGVYGLVAGIVKLDDLGLSWHRSAGPGPGPRLLRALGAGMLKAAPLFMQALAVAGTVAMFLVGGGILSHGLPGAAGGIAALTAALAAVPRVGGLLGALAPSLVNATVGVLAGAVVLGGVRLAVRMKAAWGRAR